MARVGEAYERMMSGKARFRVVLKMWGRWRERVPRPGGLAACCARDSSAGRKSRPKGRPAAVPKAIDCFLEVRCSSGRGGNAGSKSSER